MNSSLVADRLRLAGILAGHGLSGLRARAGLSLHALAWLGSRAPERLLIAPQDIRTADPTIATDLYSGWVSFAGRTVDTHGRSPFEIVAPNDAWLAALDGFGWLRHLRAADTALARVNGRALVADWIRLRGRPDRSLGWSAPVAARRLLSWLSQSPLILAGADRAFYRQFMKSVGRHGAVLQRAYFASATAENRLLVVIALAALGLCAEGLGKAQKRWTRWLVDELGREILPDGGHVSRNPQMLVDLLHDLLPLRQAYAARGLEPPPVLLNSIDRMMPMLRLFRHGDGTLALFNGMGTTEPDAVATALAYDDARAAPLENAPWSGYQRIEAGEAVLVMDTGKAPRPPFARKAHAGSLAFELSSAGQPLIVNCGAAQRERPAVQEAARSTAAHSTLVVQDASSCRFAASSRLGSWLRGQIVAGPKNVDVTRTQDEAGVLLQASHDGYARRFGVLHRRRVKLDRTGRKLEGEDRLVTAPRRGLSGTSPTHYAVRFHLAPSTQAELVDEDTRVSIALADGQRWSMTAGGNMLALEESIFFAAPDGSRNTAQIVVHLDARVVSSLQWRLERRS